MRKYNLKLHPDKCEFLRKEISYLGHIIGHTAVRLDEKRIEVVRNNAEPRTTRELKGFLYLAAYYRRFIKKFSKIAKPLTELLKNDTPYIWNEKTDSAFITLKALLTTEPLLQYPDLTTDASNGAIGAVLIQSLIGKDLRIAFASRTRNNAEKLPYGRKGIISYCVGMQTL
jgi:hypothetical protein